MPNLATLLALIALVLGGCAATPEASRESDAAAKQFEYAPRAAVVYVYRADSPNMGTATLWADGRLVGQTLPRTYFRVIVRPGRNRINAAGNDLGQIEIETEENGVYFVAVAVSGEAEGSSLTQFALTPPETGKVEILRCCTLLETWHPGQWRIPL